MIRVGIAVCYYLLLMFSIYYLQVIQAGVLPYLIDMLAEWASSSAKEAAGLTLRTITAGDMTIKRSVVEAGVVPPLVRVLQTGTPTVWPKYEYGIKFLISRNKAARLVADLAKL